MRIRRGLQISLAAFSLACLASPMAAPAQQADPTGAPPAAALPGVEADPTRAALNQEGRIREVKLENVPFNDVIQYLREADPGFQAVVTYEAGIDPPVIQDLRLKNVSSSSVLRLIADAYRQISLNQDDESGAWVIRIRQDGSKPRGDRQESVETSVHRLREIIDEMVGRDVAAAAADGGKGNGRKKAIGTVLSLLEAALMTDGEAKGASLRLHEETETLLFRGTPQQTNLVADALASMKSPEDVQGSKDKQLIQALTQELDAWRKRYGTAQSPQSQPTPAKQ